MNQASAALFWCAIGVYVCAAALMVGYIVRPTGFRRDAGRWLVRAAFGVHTIALVPLAVRSGNIPINNVFESFVFLLWCMALVGLAIEQMYNLPTVSAFLLPLLAALSVAAAWFVDDAAELPPGLSRFWLLAHVVPIFLAFAAFAGAFVSSVMYLVQQRQLKRKTAGALLDRLPSLEVLDTISARALLWGFPLLTVGILCGLVWLRARHLLLAPLHTDWKIWGGAVTWAVYAVLLHLRLRVRQHGKRIAALTVLSFALVLATFAGVFLVGGRHAFHPSAPGDPDTSMRPAGAVQHRA